MRFIVEAPVAGVAYSLQDKGNKPVDARRSTGDALVFDFTIRLADGPRFFGEHVRPEGPTRRFVYLAIGQPAGDAASPWSRRMKIDIHTIAPALLNKARAGMILEATIHGTAKDGTPACATVPARWAVVAS